MNTILTSEIETIIQRISLLLLLFIFWLDISQVGHKNTSVIIATDIWGKKLFRISHIMSKCFWCKYRKTFPYFLTP